jgi:cytochrome b involved in lipid metabolism
MNFTRYDWNEIEKHSNEKDAWIVIDGYVYNVTDFLNIHPGGADVIIERLGRDATEAFNNSLIHAHSQNALEMMKKFRIGVVKDKQVFSNETRDRFSNIFCVFSSIKPSSFI